MSIKYTADHEWVKLEADDIVLVGITNHAQEQLGDENAYNATLV